MLYLHKKIRLLALLFAVSCIVGSCQNKQVAKNGKNDSSRSVKIQQTSDQLLEGIAQAVCYSGFRDGQHPDRGNGANNPTYEETLEDLLILSRDSNFGLIRLYDSGENSELVLKVIAENTINIKVLLGIWLQAEVSNHEGCSWLDKPIPDQTLLENTLKNKTEIQNGIRLATAYSDIVVAVAVGNEALVDWNDHMVSIDAVIGYVKEVKNAIKQPVTVADNYDWWVKNGALLAQVVDFLSIHVYPVWVGKDIDEGMSYTIENVQEVRNAFPAATIVITEAGWATVASEFGDRASEQKQEQYFKEMMRWSAEMNITTFFFEAFDENWKGDPENMMGAEKHWGLFTANRKPKKVMRELYPDLD
jgi:exo-beta-1,3-glucanase (GH17 family)